MQSFKLPAVETMGQTDGQIAAAAQTKLANSHGAREKAGGQHATLSHQATPLTPWRSRPPGCRSRMLTASTRHAIGRNDFQKAEEQKDARNVNTAQRADHTAGGRGGKGLPSLCQDFFFPLPGDSVSAGHLLERSVPVWPTDWFLRGSRTPVIGWSAGQQL